MNTRIEPVERKAALEPALEETRGRTCVHWALYFAGLWALACGSNAASDRPMNASAGSGSSSAPPWCAVQAVLQAKCQRCHQAPPLHGAPFSLISYADTQVLDSKGKARFERIASAVETDLMPAVFITLTPAVEPLTPNERATLLTWCAASAPLNGTENCPASPP